MNNEMILAITEHYVKEYVAALKERNLTKLSVVASVLSVLNPTLSKEIKKVHGEL